MRRTAIDPGVSKSVHGLPRELTKLTWQPQNAKVYGVSVHYINARCSGVAVRTRNANDPGGCRLISHGPSNTLLIPSSIPSPSVQEQKRRRRRLPFSPSLPPPLRFSPRIHGDLSRFSGPTTLSRYFLPSIAILAVNLYDFGGKLVS